MELSIATLLIFLVSWPILSFASYRITRFIAIDSLLEPSRGRFHVFLANKTGKLAFLWHKLLDLISCTFCIGFYVSLVLYSLYFWECPIDFNQVDWIHVFAVAGLQALLHTWEVSDE